MTKSETFSLPLNFMIFLCYNCYLKYFLCYRTLCHAQSFTKMNDFTSVRLWIGRWWWWVHKKRFLMEIFDHIYLERALINIVWALKHVITQRHDDSKFTPGYMYSADKFMYGKGENLLVLFSVLLSSALP